MRLIEEERVFFSILELTGRFVIMLTYVAFRFRVTIDVRPETISPKHSLYFGSYENNIISPSKEVQKHAGERRLNWPVLDDKIE